MLLMSSSTSHRRESTRMCNELLTSSQRLRKWSSCATSHRQIVMPKLRHRLAISAATSITSVSQLMHQHPPPQLRRLKQHQAPSPPAQPPDLPPCNEAPPQPCHGASNPAWKSRKASKTSGTQPRFPVSSRRTLLLPLSCLGSPGCCSEPSLASQHVSGTLVPTGPALCLWARSSMATSSVHTMAGSMMSEGSASACPPPCPAPMWESAP